MKKSLLIGIFVLVIGLGLVLIGVLNLMPGAGKISFDNMQSSTGKVDNLELFSVTDSINPISSPHTSIIIQILLDSSNAGQEYTIRLDFRLDMNYGDFLAGDINEMASITVISSSSGSIEQFEISITESSLSIPLLFPGFPLPSGLPRTYLLSIDSDNSFEYNANSIIKSRITFPIGMVVAIIGVIFVVVGFLKKDSSSTKRTKRLEYQPAFEPTIGSGTRKSSKRTKSSKKSSKSGKRSSKRSKKGSAKSSTCNSCAGVMPRNSQYCPHCYARQ